jgi:hypothetical protein
MAATYEPIASVTLGSTSGTISFDSIAATWTDLVLVVNYGMAASGPTLRVRFNDDTGSNYSHTFLFGNGSAAGSFRYSSETSGAFGFGSVGGASTQTNLVIAHIMHYANTNVYKTALSMGSEASREIDRTVTLWRSTAAITKVSVSPGTSFPSQNFASGATASLYGIQAA